MFCISVFHEAFIWHHKMCSMLQVLELYEGLPLYFSSEVWRQRYKILQGPKRLAKASWPVKPDKLNMVFQHGGSFNPMKVAYWLCALKNSAQVSSCICVFGPLKHVRDFLTLDIPNVIGPNTSDFEEPFQGVCNAHKYLLLIFSYNDWILEKFTM